MDNKLEKKYDPAGWQWQEKGGRIYDLEELTREDLLQVACDCIEAMSQIDSMAQGLKNIIDTWNSGNLVPVEPGIEDMSDVQADRVALCIQGGRMRQGLTREGLSVETGIPVVDIVEMERGCRPVDRTEADKLEKALRLDRRLFLSQEP